MKLTGMPSVSCKSPRIGYLVSQYPAVNHTFILREIQTLRRTGFEIHVVSIRTPDRPATTLSADEAAEYNLTETVLATIPWGALRTHIRVAVTRPLAYLRSLLYTVRLGGGKIRRTWRLLLFFAEAVIAGDRFALAGCVHIHSHFSSTVALLTAHLFGFALSVTIHGPAEFEDRDFLMAEKVSRCTFVATISRYGANRVMQAADPRDRDKVLALPLGVDPTVFHPPTHRQRSADGKVRMVSVGRLAPVKGYHLLITAIGKLVSEGRSNLSLTVVGDGPLRSSLEELVARLSLADVVRLLPFCNHDRVIEFYRDSDIFVLSSLAEGVPVVLMEAMAMELPCIGSRIAGIPELIRDGTDGLLVPASDTDALAAALGRLIDCPELCERLGKAGRRRVMECYNLGPNVERLAEVFREMVPVTSEASAATCIARG
jgi:glycosyltransferase involved in cell wall biosynthesis